MSKVINVSSLEREQMIDITDLVNRSIVESDNDNGVVTLFVQHTTCGLTVNENADPDVQHDMLLFLRELVPQYYSGFKHFEHNSDAHIKSSLMGSTLTIPFEEGILTLGRWQGVYLCEFDGPRERKVVLTVS